MNDSLHQQASAFVEDLLVRLERARVNVAAFPLDHLCYRVETLTAYHERQREWSAHGRRLGEALIDGRPIATYRFDQPLRVGTRDIYCIEIPAPKSGARFAEGFEHAEFVIPDSFANFMAQHPHLEFDLRGIHKSVNPELILPLGEICAKFHHQSLESIIALEQSGFANK
ncbi:MAG: VOC family protein [Bdellovibrionales bacterium]|nr:VOC family protein [Bdellovibrionales bacterium]